MKKLILLVLFLLVSCDISDPQEKNPNLTWEKVGYLTYRTKLPDGWLIYKNNALCYIPGNHNWELK